MEELDRLRLENQRLRLEIDAIRKADKKLPKPLQMVLALFDFLAKVDYTELDKI